MVLDLWCLLDRDMCLRKAFVASQAPQAEAIYRDVIASQSKQAWDWVVRAVLCIEMLYPISRKHTSSRNNMMPF